MSKPVCIVWMNEARVYEQALARAGLGDRLEFHGVRVDQTIPADLAARGAHAAVTSGWQHDRRGLAALSRAYEFSGRTAPTACIPHCDLNCSVIVRPAVDFIVDGSKNARKKSHSAGCYALVF